MQFSCILGYITNFLANFNMLGIKKTCTKAEKCSGGTGRGCKSPEGAEGCKKENESLQKELEAPKQPPARSRIYGAMRHNILV